jgi:hypothetical protein
MTIVFGPPFPLTLDGTTAFGATGISETFASIPDIPITKLLVQLDGGPSSLVSAGRTLCSAASTVGGSFVAHSGASATATAPLTVHGCAGASTITIPAQRDRVSPSGVVDVLLSCAGSPCSGKLKLAAAASAARAKHKKQRRNGAPIALGSASFTSLAAGKTSHVTVHLSRAAVALLARRHGVLQAGLTVDYPPAPGAATKTVSRGITLERSKTTRRHGANNRRRRQR